MKNQFLIFGAALTVSSIQLFAQALPAQPAQPDRVFAFQAPGVMGTIVPDMPRPTVGPVVAGSPFSGKEIRRTVQTLGDGTQLENASVTMYYRDSLGRTRTEPQDGSSIRITDPVGGFTYQVNVAAKTAVRMAMPSGGGGGRAMVGARGGAATTEALEKAMAELAALKEADALKAQKEADAVKKAVKRVEPAAEDLGIQTQNGVMAQGTRTTVTIPQGQIGNNRDIHVVNERWYSKDLQMMVKTVNSDPRFGTTTYELTDIAQGNPDATLFQLPAGYTVTERGGRGGR